MANHTPEKKLSIYYDGACIVCSREMTHYKKIDAGQCFRFVDIASPEFDPVAEKIDREAADRALHVKTEDGRVVTRVAAFAEIWKRLPGHGWMARLASFRALQPVLNFGYDVFARLRRHLPKRKMP